MTLISTVTSYTKKIYARAGSKVTVISEYGSISIVEFNGNRFATKTENLK